MPSSERKKISVITTTFNLIKGGRKDVFIEMFKSVHGQTYPNIEHLIIDGGSKDGTIEFINDVNRQYGKKQLVIFSEPDKGITDATIKGFHKSTGDYVILMPSDDYYMRNDALMLLADAMESENKEYACADSLWHKLQRDIADIESFMYRHPFLIHTWLVKRQVFEKYGYFDSSFELAADLELMMRILSKPDVNGIEVHKVLVCLRPGGISQQPDLNLATAELWEAYKKTIYPNEYLSKEDVLFIHGGDIPKILIERIESVEKNIRILKSIRKGKDFNRPYLTLKKIFCGFIYFKGQKYKEIIESYLCGTYKYKIKFGFNKITTERYLFNIMIKRKEKGIK